MFSAEFEFEFESGDSGDGRAEALQELDEEQS